MAIAQLRIDPRQGEVILELRAERALPVSGVLSSSVGGHLDPVITGDASIVQWILPPVDALYVAYGVILPLSKLWFAPSYSRRILQGNSLVSGIANPRRIKTEKHAEGEWVGPPEAFRILMQA